MSRLNVLIDTDTAVILTYTKTGALLGTEIDIIGRLEDSESSSDSDGDNDQGDDQELDES